jgi:hypothetical protein
LRVGFALLLSAGALSLQEAADAPVRFTAGERVFEWVHGWGKLPEGMQLGNTHGCIVVDAKDNVYLNTDTENAVVVFDPDGTFVRAFGKELAGGLHGMALVREEGQEFLLLAHIGRHQVLKSARSCGPSTTRRSPGSTPRPTSTSRPASRRSPMAGSWWRTATEPRGSTATTRSTAT